MGMIYDNAVEEKKIDEKKLESIVRRLSKIGREMDKMGLQLFGGSGSGTLRTSDHTIIADIDGAGCFDGGDGGCRVDDKGILRGEPWWDSHRNDG